MTLTPDARPRQAVAAHAGPIEGPRTPATVAGTDMGASRQESVLQAARRGGGLRALGVALRRLPLQPTGRRPPDSPARVVATYRLARAVITPVVAWWVRLRIEGGEHLAVAGPLIVACNHRSNLDPLLVACAAPRGVHFLSKEELFVGPLGWGLWRIGQVPVRRGGVDRSALDGARSVLQRGWLLGVFPEGTRGAGDFAQVQAGIAWLVVRQAAPVVPVVIVGSERLSQPWGWLPRRWSIRIVVGPPLQVMGGEGKAGREAAMESLSAQLRRFLDVVTQANTGPADPPALVAGPSAHTELQMNGG